MLFCFYMVIAKFSGDNRRKAERVPAPSTTGPNPAVTKSTKSDAAGLYRLKPVAHGKYTVTVTAPGFPDFVADDINIKLGETTKLDVGMVID